MQQLIETGARIRTRIAPTPSGYLHIGNMLSFAITWALARRQNGQVILRIDDLDSNRLRPAYLNDIFDTLHFLGIDYDEGPTDAADFNRNFSQQHRLPAYHRFLSQLADQGLLYSCSCSRTQIKALAPKGHYSLTCRGKQLPLESLNTAWRICIPDNTGISLQDLLLGNRTVDLSKEMPDFVVRRKDEFPAYQVASVCDDLLMGVNLIVRGEDLLTSTAAQLFLTQQAGNTDFGKIRFAHHPVVREANGDKLSKSEGALSIKEMRKSGLKAAAVWEKVARLLGWKATPITSAAEFLDRFRLEDIPLGSYKTDQSTIGAGTR